MVIGITGGTGCGKSTVSKILSEKLSVPIIDADKIAHSAWTVDEILTELREFLGDDIFINGKDVDRRKVSAIVFNDSAKLQKLNSIIHPYVMNEIEKQVQSFSGICSYVILDVPLPNKQFFEISDYVVTVWASLGTRIERLKKRTGLTEEAILARINKQMSEEEYTEFANIVIYNDGMLEDLQDSVDELIKKI